MDALRRLGFGARLALATSLLVAGVCVAQSWLLGPRAVAHLARALRDVGHAASTDLARAAGPSLVAADLAGLRLLAEQARARTDIAYCRFYDARGLLLSSTGRVGTAAPPPTTAAAEFPANPIEVGTEFWEFRAPVLVEAPAAPSGAARADHPRPPERAGTVAVGVSLASLHALRRQTVATAILVTSLFTGLGIVGAGLLARAITGPLRALAVAARAITVGDFTTQVPVGAGDEVGQLAGAFNTMAQSLAQSRNALEEKVEQLERANHLKSEFLATVSHELRTPLNVILGHAEMLLDGAGGQLTPEQADMLATIDRYSKLQLELITNVLDFSRLASGQVSYHVERFTIGPLLDDVLALHRGRLRERRIVLGASVHAALSPLETDRVKLQEILQNLVDNAAKFTQSGAVTVTAGPGAEPGWVGIEVTDTGPGIAPEELPLIFDPFHQIGASSTRRTGGTGLGLSIVRHLAGALGGRVSVTSRLGHGSTFRVEIPVRLPGAWSPLPEPTAANALDGVARNRRRLAAATPASPPPDRAAHRGRDERR